MADQIRRRILAGAVAVGAAATMGSASAQSRTDDGPGKFDINADAVVRAAKETLAEVDAL